MNPFSLAVAAWNTLVLTIHFVAHVTAPTPAPVVVMPACVQCQTIEMMADGPENMRDGARGTVATPDPQFDANMADWQP